MPKMKSHSGAKKRFRFTASGKLKHSAQNRRHILTKKASKRKRQLRNTRYVDVTQEATIAKMIGGQK